MKSFFTIHKKDYSTFYLISARTWELAQLNFSETWGLCGPELDYQNFSFASNMRIFDIFDFYKINIYDPRIVWNGILCRTCWTHYAFADGFGFRKLFSDCWNCSEVKS